jgi:hypothetical protein
LIAEKTVIGTISGSGRLQILPWILYVGLMELLKAKDYLVELGALLKIYVTLPIGGL